VVASGGSSYPSSGTTGDGWEWLRAVGHTIKPTRAALAPIYLREARPDLSGVAVRDCALKARSAGREIAKATGDVLFTHHGLSGPATLKISRAVAEQHGEMLLFLDLLPDVPFEAVAVQLQEWAMANPSRLLRAFAEPLVPERLVPELLASASAYPSLPGSRLDRRTRNRVAETIKSWPLGAVRAVPLEKGEVVAGGLSLDEIDPRTMESKIVRGLYPCGELLDVAGPIGGYNLQAAFATGFVAGESAAKAALADVHEDVAG
jgi:hypothetical protein